MPIRKGSAVWEGSFRDGRGSVKLGSGMFEGPYSAASRFESAKGTNPEELIGAAHAGCFSMALALMLGAKGKAPKRIETTAEVRIEPVGPGFKITGIALRTEAEVPEISEAEFQDVAAGAKTGCPVSQALAATPITLEARLKR